MYLRKKRRVKEEDQSEWRERSAAQRAVNQEESVSVFERNGADPKNLRPSDQMF